MKNKWKPRQDRAKLTREQILKKWNAREAEFRKMRRWIINSRITNVLLAIYAVMVILMQTYHGDLSRDVEFFSNPIVMGTLVGGVAWVLTAVYFAGRVFWIASIFFILAAMSGAVTGSLRSFIGSF